ncbi:hypothetical protein QTP88_024182 [Uroleucon formosanum]
MDSTNIIDDLDFEKLIDVMRSHPAIWNISISDCSDKIKKENSWNEACKSLYNETWENLSTNDKRTTGAKKIRKYVYANFLAFLDSTFEQREYKYKFKKKKSKTHQETADDETQSILDFIKSKSKSKDEDYHFAMFLVPEIKRYQNLPQSGRQSNTGVQYYQHQPSESDDDFSQFIHQPQQLLPTSDYQIPLNYMNSSEHYSQHFARTQPTTSSTMGHDQIAQTLTDLLSQPNIQSSPQNLASTHTSTY